jgi:hypothetical protein
MARMSVGEGMTGMADGAIVKSVNNNIQLQQAGELYNRADATLQAAEANVQSLTSAEYSLTEQSTRRVYVRCHRREHGIFEVEITGEAEPSAIVTFVGVENAHTLLRQFQANIAMVSVCRAKKFSNTSFFMCCFRENLTILVVVGCTYLKNIEIISNSLVCM